MNAKQLFAAVTMTMGVWGTAVRATTIADWTFETTQPATAGPFAAEVGSGTALGLHASSAAVYSSPVGNGSSHSFSANTWTVGDYYQFSVSTVGLADVTLSWDQTSSNTGPRDFELAYSTDGTNFTAFTNYSVLANASPNSPWSGAGSRNSAYTFSEDLSSVAALGDQAAIYLRLVDVDTTAANGTTVGAAGTDRVDNFFVSATPVPLPAAAWLLGGGVLGLAGLRRRRTGA